MDACQLASKLIFLQVELLFTILIQKCVKLGETWVICVIFAGKKDQWCTVNLMQPAYAYHVTVLFIQPIRFHDDIQGHLYVKGATCNLHLLDV